MCAYIYFVRVCVCVCRSIESSLSAKYNCHANMLFQMFLFIYPNAYKTVWVRFFFFLPSCYVFLTFLRGICSEKNTQLTTQMCHYVRAQSFCSEPCMYEWISRHNMHLTKITHTAHTVKPINLPSWIDSLHSLQCIYVANTTFAHAIFKLIHKTLESNASEMCVRCERCDLKFPVAWILCDSI